MRKLFILAVLAATVCLITADTASARGRGCRSRCNGCSSGCYSGGYGGCYGGGYGCYSGGGYGCSSGGYGCYSGGYGGGYPVGVGCTGYGCYGRGGVIVPMPPVKGTEEKKDGKGKVGTPEEPISLEATLVVTLPADAKLKIDDYQTVSTSGTRVFTTPALALGKDYSYTLKAEVVRDGKTQSVEQIVKVRAGETTPVTLTIGTGTSVAGR